MTLVGFKRMYIGVHSDLNTVQAKDIITIEGKQDKGATVNAEITGLASEPVKVYGSDIAYYVMQKGTGDVAVNFGILDMLSEVHDKIAGYKTTTDGFSLIGEDTEPPYCSIILESSDLRGNPVLVGFFKGKFTYSEMAMNTKTGEQTEPEADGYTFNAIASDLDGERKGNTVVKYLATGKDDAKIAAFKKFVIPSNELPEG